MVGSLSKNTYFVVKKIQVVEVNIILLKRHGPSTFPVILTQYKLTPSSCWKQTSTVNYTRPCHSHHKVDMYSSEISEQVGESDYEILMM